MANSYSILLKSYGFKKYLRFGEEMWINKSSSEYHTIQFGKTIFAERKLFGQNKIVSFDGYVNMPLSEGNLRKILVQWFP